jgi:hypothetical protein
VFTEIDLTNLRFLHYNFKYLMTDHRYYATTQPLDTPLHCMVTRFRNRALFAQDCTQASLAQRNPIEKRFPFACLTSQSLEGTGHFARTGAALKRRWPLAPGPATGKPASLRGGIDRDLRGLDRYLSHSGGGYVTLL